MLGKRQLIIEFNRKTFKRAEQLRKRLNLPDWSELIRVAFATLDMAADIQEMVQDNPGWCLGIFKQDAADPDTVRVVQTVTLLPIGTCGDVIDISGRLKPSGD